MVKVKVLTYATHVTIIKLENKLQANVYLLSKQNMKQTRAFQNIHKIVWMWVCMILCDRSCSVLLQGILNKLWY